MPQTVVEIDRSKMAELGIQLDEITRTLEVCFSARIDGFDDIVVRCADGNRADENVMPRPADMKQLKVRSVGGSCSRWQTW